VAVPKRRYAPGPGRAPWLDRSHPKVLFVLVALSIFADALTSIPGSSTSSSDRAMRVMWLLGSIACYIVVAALVARWRHTRPLALMVAVVLFTLGLLAITYIGPALFTGNTYQIDVAGTPVYTNVSDTQLQMGVTPMLFICLAVYYVALAYGTPAAVGWFAGLLVGELTVSVLRVAIQDRSSFGTLAGEGLIFGLLQGLLAMVALALAGRRRYLEDLLERNRLLAVERDQRAQLAVAAERGRIAAEMHDIVSHSLAVMVTLADGAGRCLPDDVPTAREAVAQIGATGRGAVADMRRLLAVLRSDADLAPQPGLADLPGLVTRLTDAGLPVTLSVTDGLPHDPSLGLAIYRIAQEGLTNVLRHAPHATWVHAAVLRPEPALVEVQVVNGPSAGSPGVGAGAGQGLVGVRQRVDVWQGTLRAGPTADGGWALIADLRV
jgi:signal transduction histidine kinase